MEHEKEILELAESITKLTGREVDDKLINSIKEFFELPPKKSIERVRNSRYVFGYKNFIHEQWKEVTPETQVILLEFNQLSSLDEYSWHEVDNMEWTLDPPVSIKYRIYTVKLSWFKNPTGSGKKLIGYMPEKDTVFVTKEIR